MRWVDKGPERAEALVSVSSDGRVTQWSMSKGLECSDLIKLKRVSTHKKVDSHSQQTHLSLPLKSTNLIRLVHLTFSLESTR